MGKIREDALYLLDKIREVINQPPPGVEPWKGLEILALVRRADRYLPDHGAFFTEFIDGVRDLVDADNPHEDRLLHKFAQQNINAEARIHGDNPSVRDHRTHVSQVFLCGWLILNGCRCFRFASADWKPYGWDVDSRERFEKLNRAWLFCSLLHDSAYSVETSSSANKWSRERSDSALAVLRSLKTLRYAATELTDFQVDDSNGLCLQVRLLRRLFPESESGDVTTIVRQLEKLPRDVPRLLFDLLASRKLLLINEQEAQRAAQALADGLMGYPTVQQWLYDTGRYEKLQF